eukprot:g11837.t1 g11837   contig6:692989-694281(-)
MLFNQPFFFLVAIIAPSSHGFISTYHRKSNIPSSVSSLAATDVDTNTLHENDAVRSPLRFLGPYPTIPLRFPHLATASQRERNVTGVSLDFVLDTAANVNTINAQVAMELGLEKVGEAPGGVGAAGGILGGDTFMLGSCELDLGLSKEKKEMIGNGDEKESNNEDDTDGFVFMQGLTASALPVASPAAAGLLSLAFFYCFEGGVEFDWSNPTGETTTQSFIPSVTFYGSDKHLNLNGMACVPFESLPVSMLPSVTLSINGVKIPALFDTGSPITVLNAKAAEAAGIATSIPMDDLDLEQQSQSEGGWNPFSKIVNSFRSASEIVQATAEGKIITIAGTDGKPVRLVKSESSVEVLARVSKLAVPASQKDKDQKQYTTIGDNYIYVGDLPGLAALGGLGGGSAPPAAVLGMDLLRCRPKIVFRAQQKEIYL